MVLIAYDISRNRVRNALIKQLRHYGFNRIQKSVFLGNMKWDDALHMIEEIDYLIDLTTDIISCYQIHNIDNSITIGNKVDGFFLAEEEFIEF